MAKRTNKTLLELSHVGAVAEGSVMVTQDGYCAMLAVFTVSICSDALSMKATDVYHDEDALLLHQPQLSAAAGRCRFHRAAYVTAHLHAYLAPAPRGAALIAMRRVHACACALLPW